MDPRSRALEQAKRHKQRHGEQWARTLRNTRITTVVMGVAFLVIGAGFGAMLVPGVGPAGAPQLVFALLCPTFALSGALSLLVSTKFAPPSAQLLAEGEPGRATVREVRGAAFSVTTQSGTVMRSALVLDIEVAPGPPYQVVHRMFVPPDCIPLLGEGSVLAVRVDRANKQRLVVDWEASRAR